MTDHFLFPAIVKLNMSFFISSHTHPLWRQSDENHDLIKILQKFNVDQKLEVNVKAKDILMPQFPISSYLWQVWLVGGLG